MLLTRDEMTYNFGDARLELERDRELLAFIFNQFLYGEVTGIQVGHWLHHAPDFAAARFFARQSVEELTHVVHIRRIFDILGSEPMPPHPLMRFLATGFIGGAFEEHVALEMAQGEGFVLMVFYALIDLIDEPRIRRTLENAVKQEERHVDFGEERTRRAVTADPALARHLLGLNLVSLIAMRRFARGAIARAADPEHPVLRQLPGFLERTTEVTEERLRRIGVLTRPLAEIGTVERAFLIASAFGRRMVRRMIPRRRRYLTDTYLDDPFFKLPATPEEDDSG